MHCLWFAAFAIGKTGDEFDEAFVRLMAGFLFHDRQAQPFGIFKAVDDRIAPRFGAAVGVPGGDQIVDVMINVGGEA